MLLSGQLKIRIIPTSYLEITSKTPAYSWISDLWAQKKLNILR